MSIIYRQSKFLPWAISINMMPRNSCQLIIITQSLLIIMVPRCRTLMRQEDHISMKYKSQIALIKLALFHQMILDFLRHYRSKWYSHHNTNKKLNWWWRLNNRWNRWIWHRLRKWKPRSGGWKHAPLKSWKMVSVCMNSKDNFLVYLKYQRLRWLSKFHF